MVVPSRLLPVLSATLLCAAAVAGCVHESADDRARLADARARYAETRRNARDLARRILAEVDSAETAALSIPPGAPTATNRDENGFVILLPESERRPVPPEVWAIATLQGDGPEPDDWPLVRRWLDAADAETRLAAARFGDRLLARTPVVRLLPDGTVERAAAEDLSPLPDRDAVRDAVDAVLAADAPPPVPPAFAATNAEVRVEAWLLAIRSNPGDGTVPDALSFLAETSAAAARGDDIPVFASRNPPIPMPGARRSEAALPASRASAARRRRTASTSRLKAATRSKRSPRPRRRFRFRPGRRSRQPPGAALAFCKSSGLRSIPPERASP